MAVNALDVLKTTEGWLILRSDDKDIVIIREGSADIMSTRKPSIHVDGSLPISVDNPYIVTFDDL